MSEEQLIAGDDAIHGEGAYSLGACEAHEHLISGQGNKVDGGVSDQEVTMGHDPHHKQERSSASGEVKKD